jgi:hypothetical protein
VHVFILILVILQYLLFESVDNDGVKHFCRVAILHDQYCHLIYRYLNLFDSAFKGKRVSKFVSVGIFVYASTTKKLVRGLNCSYNHRTFNCKY